MTQGLTPYITPAMLLSANFGISWSTFPKQGSSAAEQVAAQLDLCATLTSDMDSICQQTLRATQDVEREFGPDFAITLMPNGWTRFQLSHWPILTLVGARYGTSNENPPGWVDIPIGALVTEHQALPLTGTIVAGSGSPGPTAALIAPGYVNWLNGRKGFYVEVTTVNGYPVAGIDQPAATADTTIHVDDVTGWWNGTAGARGTIYDPPFRETVTVAGFTPDDVGATSGPGTLTLTTGLRFPHNPKVGLATEPDQTILLSSMPPGLIQGGYYLATYYGLIRGATAAIVQTARGTMTGGGGPGQAQTWYEQAEKTLGRYARTL